MYRRQGKINLKNKNIKLNFETKVLKLIKFKCFNIKKI